MGKPSQQNLKLSSVNANSNNSRCTKKITSTNNTNNNNEVITRVKRSRRTFPRDSPPQRSSIYRGVTRHRWTGRYEAHLWDKDCWNESQKKKGRQVYLGAYDDEDAAAHAYDLAALKYWGAETILNFPLSIYHKELKEMEAVSREEYIGSLRRKSNGFSRGVSQYRGVARHHHNGRWEARIGRVFGNKYLYLGTYATQEAAAAAYDMAAIEYRGLNAVTNFDLSRYLKWLKPNNNQNTNAKNIDTNNNIELDNNSNSNIKNNLTPNLQNNPNMISTTNYYSTPRPNQEPGLSFQAFDHNHDQLQQVQSRPAMATNATSALGLLFQSAKFKEMMEMASMGDYCPSMPNNNLEQLDSSAQCSFPEEVQFQTFNFGGQDSGSYGSHEGDHHHTFFGELDSLVPLVFQRDFLRFHNFTSRNGKMLI